MGNKIIRPIIHFNSLKEIDKININNLIKKDLKKDKSGIFLMDKTDNSIYLFINHTLTSGNSIDVKLENKEELKSILNNLTDEDYVLNNCLFDFKKRLISNQIYDSYKYISYSDIIKNNNNKVN
jgi:hypothetical protein